MSGVDPLAALAAQVVAASDAAIADATLNLGEVAQLLVAQLSVGDVLEATVLPPQGGTDLLQFAGQTVAAQLPPDVHPGDTLLLQVTGFSGQQILVRNLGVQDPQNPVTVVSVETPPLPEGSPQTAVLTNAPPAPAPPPATTPVAPPVGVFVAASVRTVQPPPTQVPAQGAPAPSVAPSAPIAAPPPAAPTIAAAPNVADQSVEARLAAARAAIPDRASVPPPPSSSTSPPAPSTPLPATPSQAGAPVAPPAATISAAARESIFFRPISVPPPLVPAAARAPIPSQAAPDAQPAASPRSLSSAIRANDAPAILAALRVPQTSVTLAAARVITTATAQVSSALQQLEVALHAQAPAQDARVATLQTLTSFAARINPGNPETLAVQLSSFVSNVLQGAETKLADLLAALSPSIAQETPQAPPAAQQPSAQTQPSAQGQPPPSASAPAAQTQVPAQVLNQAQLIRTAIGATDPRPAGSPALGGPNAQTAGAANTPASASAAAPLLAPQAPPEHVAILAHARAVEREAAITQDLKSTVLSLLANPPQHASAQLTQALSETLAALTGAQLGMLASNQLDPSTLVLNLPVYFFQGGQATQLRVSRDAPKKNARMDADNFHIAFVLDTQSLGTVAIDLETVGRSVKLNVKTDRAPALSRFRNSLSELGGRLESLRYRISSLGAEMAPRGIAPQPLAPAPKSNAQLDLQA